MRPDEHKKKHRVEYKKKHGISNKKTASKERSETSEENSNAETHAKEDLVESEQGDQAHFSRRKVASNWGRYEELELESNDEEDNAENIEKRGEDFGVLLEKSENPASQFRFQSEREWDQESNASTIEVSNSALEVDFTALAKVLNCIPLHKRLDISPALVHPDLVKEFETTAELHKKNQSILSQNSTDTRNTETTATTELTSTLSDSCHHSSLLNNAQNNQQNFETKTLENYSSISIHATKSSDKDMQGSVTQSVSASEPYKPKNAGELQSSLKDVLRTANATASNTITGKLSEEPAKNEDDGELEFLLSLGTPGVNKNSDSFAVLHSNKEAQSQKALPLGDMKCGNQPGNNNADDDLEDWLDSVLG